MLSCGHDGEMKITLADIEAARERIAGVANRTPIEYSATASKRIGVEAYFKFENLQRTGSFKIRGALNKISTLTDSEKKRGVIAASAGNHAQGVALSATLLQVSSTIVMPKNSSIIKQEATRNYGAQVVLHGDFYDEAYQHAREIEKKTGAVFIHAFEDPHIMAGQGTIGLEILEDLPDLDSVVVAIGGGGMISGIATAIKAKRPTVKVFGAVAANAPAMAEMFRGQTPVARPTCMSIADGIAVKTPSETMFKNFVKPLVDDIVTISEDDIAESVVFLLERCKSVAEGSGAITLAAAKQLGARLGKNTCIVVSGGNIDLTLMEEILDRGLTRNGRRTKISVVVDDRPGSLLKLTKIVSQSGANIIQVEHDRVDPALQIRETRISFILETKNRDHIEEIRAALRLEGVRILL